MEGCLVYFKILHQTDKLSIGSKSKSDQKKTSVGCETCLNLNVYHTKNVWYYCKNTHLQQSDQQMHIKVDRMKRKSDDIHALLPRSTSNTSVLRNILVSKYVYIPDMRLKIL